MQAIEAELLLKERESNKRLLFFCLNSWCRETNVQAVVRIVKGLGQELNLLRRHGEEDEGHHHEEGHEVHRHEEGHEVHRHEEGHE